MAKKLGISKDTQAKAGIPINAPRKLDKHNLMFPNGWEFPIAQLVKVYSDPAKVVTRNNVEETLPILGFVFMTSTGKQYTHIEFPLDDEDAKFESKLEGLNQRIKHLFEESVGANKFKEEDFQGDDFVEFFGNCAKAFNKEVMTKGEGEDMKTTPIYTTNHLYIKLTYYKDRVQLPLYPNFVQKAFAGGQGVPCELLINPTHDKTEPVAKASQAAAYGGGTNNSFGGEGDAGFPSFPSIP